MDNSLQGKRLLLLGGVRPACEIVKAAKQMGIVTVVADYLENSPAKEIADESYLVDAANVDEIVSFCRQKNIDGIITGYVDFLLPFYQQDCELLQFPCWGTAENIQMCINKELFKIACEQAGVPVVPWKKVNRDNFKESLDDIPLPMIVKPVDNSGARGVFKCTDCADMESVVEKSLTFSKIGEALIEKAMNPNNEFSVYYMLDHGEYYLTGMGDRYVQIVDENVAPEGQGMYFPSGKLPDWIRLVDPAIRKFFRDNQMMNGFVFVQGFFEEGSFYIHEIGYRLNGGYSFKLVEHFSKYNQVKELIRFSLTGAMDVQELKKSDPYFSGHGMIVTASLKHGTIGEIEGIDAISQLPCVIDFCQLHNKGDVLSTKGTTAQVFAYILCASDTAQGLRDTIVQIRSLLRVKDTDGNNMLNDFVNPDRINMTGGNEK